MSSTGVIAAVTSFGLFVELVDLYIEGLVHITALPEDYYEFDKAHQRLVGQRSGRSFQIGGRSGCKWPGSTSTTRKSTWN